MERTFSIQAHGDPNSSSLYIALPLKDGLRACGNDWKRKPEKIRSTNLLYIPCFLIAVLLVACDGDDGSNGSSGDPDSGAVIDRLVEQYNRSTNTLITGGLYEFDFARRVFIRSR